MKTSLLQGLSEEEAKIVLEEFKRCPTLRRSLRNLFKRKAEGITKDMVFAEVTKDYALYQAQRSAEARAYLNFFSLLED